MRISDWSSDVCSSDLIVEPGVRIISAAEVPAAPHTPSPMVATTVGLTASVVISCLLALLLEQSDKTLRSARQVEQHLGLPCLALVPTLARRSEEHTSELQSLMRISYAVFCLKNKTQTTHSQQQCINT